MHVRSLVAGIALSGALAFGAPVAIPNAGLTVELPQGWSLDSSVSSSGKPSYLLLPDGSQKSWLMVSIELYDSLDPVKDTGWAYDQTYGYKVWVDYEPCPTQVFSWAASTQDGLASSYINTTQSLDSLCAEYRAFHVRYFATGTHGWEVMLMGDTAQIQDNYSTYAAMLDSIKVDRSWTGWTPVSGIHSRSLGARLRVLRGAQGLEVLGSPQALGDLVDPRGRRLAGFRLDAQGRASLPTPRGAAWIRVKDPQGGLLAVPVTGVP